MTTAADTTFLDKALTELESVRRWTPRTISKLEALMNTPDPWALYRVNPLTFAKERGISETESIDLFLYATHIGLFQMEWRLLCPICSDTVSSCRSMSVIQSKCFCQLCQMGVEVKLDDFICISFNLSPRVRDLPWHHPENLSVDDLMFRYRIDATAVMAKYGKFSDVMRQFTKFTDYVKPGETREIETEVPPGFAAVGFDIANFRAFILGASGAPSKQPQVISAKMGKDGWVLSPEKIMPGVVRFVVTNPTQQRIPLVLYVRPNEGGPPDLKLDPFLTGNRLLSNQTFRTLFRAETLATGEGLAVRDLTLLFTDLKGSTELYERVGDMSAFALVQQHFEHLRRAIQEQDGAVVKTIGDAVMASFVRPDQAVKAALAMWHEIEQFNKRRGSRDLILKIGVHRGQSIAVTLNDRLDYFGQTVNTAARVQGIANADELCITQDVMDAPGVAALFKGMKLEEESARLKGIAELVKVYRVSLG
jgi:class 3 adenylate cyclase